MQCLKANDVVARIIRRSPAKVKFFEVFVV